MLHKANRIFSNATRYIQSVARFSTSSTPKTALVTGGNRGIGLQACKQLCDKNWNVIMSTRSLDRGKESINKYFSKDRRDKISLLELDINDTYSIADAVKQVEQNYDNIDLLVNNAGIHYDYGMFKHTGLSKKLKIMNTISTNYFGTLEFTHKLLPHMTDSRIICLSNRDSALKKLSAQFRHAFLDDALDENGLHALMIQYQKAAIDGDHCDVKDMLTTPMGWINSCYLMSYVGVNIFCKLLGNTLQANPENTNWIASYCPGHCATDSTDYFGCRQPSESAFGIVTLAEMMLNEDTPNGAFWAAFYKNELDDLENVDLEVMDLTHPTETISWDTLCDAFVSDPKIQAFE